MRSRLMHACAACATFCVVAAAYGLTTGVPVERFHVALWSAAGVVSYIALSYLFGFDPYRSRVASGTRLWVRYVDRWELRSGQATLAMLGLMVVCARLFDPSRFVAAVVSSTLSAWTYFTWRLYAGGYDIK